MGLSASQARLLSITARLSDNELHSQQISNSKVRLADKTQDASKVYIDALNTQNLMYTAYDSNGKTKQTALTAGLLYTFSDLKNQYGISNTSGQLMVNSTDAKNFQKSANVNEFLQEYGVPLVDNPLYALSLQSIYGNEYKNFHKDDDFNYWDNFLNNLTNGGIGTINTIIGKDSKDLTPEDAAKVMGILGGWSGSIKDTAIENYKTLAGSFGGYVGEIFNNPNLKFPDKYADEYYEEFGNPELANKFMTASKGCYDQAMWGGKECYLHVLAHLLDLNIADVDSSGNVAIGYSRNYTTTAGGGVVKIDSSNINGSNINSSKKTKDMAEISEYICNPDNKIMASGDPSDTTTKDSTILEKLLSNYKFVIDESGKTNKELKTFKEKIADLFYVVQNRETFKNVDGSEAISFDQLKPYLASFQTDMANALTKVFKEDEYLADVDSWKNSISMWMSKIEPAKKEYQEALKKIPTPKIPDEKDPKTSWYTNLWHRLNGASDYKSEEGKTGKYYKQLEDSLLTNKDWLKFALEHGVVTMEQVQFVDNTESDTGLKTSKWKATSYSTCSDISSADDEVARAKAEAEYTLKLNEIETKDKKYDNDLKKLDTEHNAMQTEYESVKGVIQKNVERSFKAFS